MSTATDRPGSAPAAVAAELGAYLLPGRVADPRRAIGQAQAAEHHGLGKVWLSERWGTKDFGVLAGAVGQATTAVGIAAGVTHFLVRRPPVLASMIMTAQALTGGRVSLAFGRSVPSLWRGAGLPAMTNQVLTDCLDMTRRLCAGERVRYDGPAGVFPAMQLGDLTPDVGAAPLQFAAIGPKSLALAGSLFDGAMLHPFLTPQAVTRSAERVRRAEREAGRPPGSCPVIATVVTAPELTADAELAVVGGRAVSYFQIPGFGERLAEVNGWSPEPLAALRAHPQLAGVRGAADSVYTAAALAEPSRVLPDFWLRDASATGSAAAVAARLHDYLDAGADELVLHGATPDLLGPVVAHFIAQRAGRAPRTRSA